jgi:hypothetical protein
VTQPQHTIGIDLAAQRAETAACVVVWEGGTATVVAASCGFDDDELVGLVQKFGPTKVAIDAPFGWPSAFVAALAAYASSGEWPVDDVSPLRLRDTDRAVIAQTRQQPLSVSSDRIAMTAMRCARFLTRLRAVGFTISRDGEGLAAEVYPAAALRVWQLDARGYKGNKPEAHGKRGELVQKISESCRGWLSFAAKEHQLFVESDHNLDAFICAVIARVLDLELTLPIPPESRDAARVEGWIHLPRSDALRRVAGVEAA